MTIDLLEMCRGAIPSDSWTSVLQGAIDHVHEAGVGTVHIPAGRFVTGPIQLKSRVALDLHVGALLVASANPEEYHAQKKIAHYGLSWISAEGADAVEVSGSGCLDGNAFNILQKLQHMLIPPGWDDFAFRLHGLRFIDCTDVTVRGIRIVNTSFWAFHLCDCKNVWIQGVSINNPVEDFCDNDPPVCLDDHVYHIINADGIDVDSCQNVRISDCNIRTSDDAICIKVTKTSKKRLCRNIVVTNCVLGTDESALKLGSETHGRFEDIVFSNCTVNYAGAAVACWLADGGVIDRWIVSNISVNLQPKVGGNVVYIRVYPRNAETISAGRMRNVFIQGVRASAPSAIYVAGSEDAIESLEIKDVALDIHGDYWPKTYEGALSKPIVHRDPPYPMPMWDQKRAPFDIYCRNILELKLSNIRLNWMKPEDSNWGSAIRCSHIKRLVLDRIEARASLGSNQADIRLRNIQKAEVRNLTSLPGSSTVFDIDAVQQMVCLGNDFTASRLLGIDESLASPSCNALPKG
jgi:hypothetical protein